MNARRDFFVNIFRGFDGDIAPIPPAVMSAAAPEGTPPRRILLV